MPIVRASAHAVRVLDASPELRIHSVFSSALNLRAGQRLINCSPGAVSAPHGIELTAGDLERLRLLHRAGPGGRLSWDPDQRVITGCPGSVVIAWTPRTRIFDTTLPVASGSGSGPCLENLIAHLARARTHTGFGPDWLDLTADPRFTSAVSSLAGGRADDHVLALLGRGPGLTPSGDDALVGMIAALWHAGVAGRPGLAPAWQALEHASLTRTTDISREYLYYACQGMVIGALRDLLVALDHCDSATLKDAVRRLGRYGHSSGMDCLLGAVTALRYLGGA